MEFLLNSGGPFDAKGVDVGGGAEPEVGVEIVAGDLTHLPGGFAAHGGFDAHFGSDGGAVGGASLQFNGEPGIAVAVVAIKAIEFAECSRDPEIEKAVVVGVDPRGGTAGGAIGADAGGGCGGTGRRRCFDKGLYVP